MARTQEPRTVFVEEVVTALTGGLNGVPPRGLRLSMERAAVEFDDRTAEAFARALFSALDANPEDLRQREALLLLGLAHPRVFQRHGISLEQEGRRYAQLLHAAGMRERAEEVLALVGAQARLPAPNANLVGDHEATIARLLARAEECIRRGYPQQAEDCLRDVLSLDPERSDVARMLRDLRSRRMRGSRRRKQVAVWGAALLILGFVGHTLFQHETRMRAAYQALPAADSNDPAVQQARLDALEVLLAFNPPWSGTLSARSERTRLRTKIDHAQRLAGDQARNVVSERRERNEEASDLRMSARVWLERGETERAIEQLNRSLNIAGENWEYRDAVLADMAAIQAWRREGNSK